MRSQIAKRVVDRFGRELLFEPRVGAHLTNPILIAGPPAIGRSRQKMKIRVYLCTIRYTDRFGNGLTEPAGYVANDRLATPERYRGS